MWKLFCSKLAGVVVDKPSLAIRYFVSVEEETGGGENEELLEAQDDEFIEFDSGDGDSHVEHDDEELELNDVDIGG